MSEIQKYDVSSEVPAYLANVNPTEGFDTNEQAPMPLVRIIQKTSKEVDNGTAKAGDVWSDAHAGVVAQFDPKTKGLKTPLHLVPCKQAIEWLHFETDASQAKHPALVGPFWRTSNPDDPRVKALDSYTDPDTKKVEELAWKIRTRHVLVALPINHADFPVEAGVLSFRGASWKIGRKAFLLEAQRAVKAPLPAQVWEMNVSQETNDAGQTYYVPVLRFAGLAPEDLYKKCSETAQAFGNLVPQLDSQSAEPDGPVEDNIPF